MLGLPWWVVVLMLVALPLVVALFFGAFAFVDMTPQLFTCRRCGTSFRARPWRRFPSRCASCGARDWNT